MSDFLEAVTLAAIGSMQHTSTCPMASYVGPWLALGGHGHVSLHDLRTGKRCWQQSHAASAAGSDDGEDLPPTMQKELRALGLL